MKNKYGAKKTGCLHGHTHDSAREAKRCNELHLLQMAGKIAGLRTQPEYWFVLDGKELKHPNGRRCGLKPDFDYLDNDTGRLIAEDSKGMRTEAFVLRAALFRHCFPDIELREV